MSRASPRFRRVSPPLPLLGPTNGAVVYKIFGTIEGQMTMSSFFYAAAVNNPTTGQLTTLLANIHTSLWAAYRSCISVDWATVKERVDVVHRNDLAGVDSFTVAGSGGTRSAGHLPTEVAIQLIRYSAVKGQHGRGRVSIPGVPTADVTGSNISAGTLVTALNTLVTQILTTVTDGGGNTYTSSICQRATGSPKLVIGSAPIVRMTVPTLLGTIRRRKIGRGK